METSFLTLTLKREIPKNTVFHAHGLTFHWLNHGVMVIEPAGVDNSLPSIILSAGVHGNETAPIELLDSIVADLQSGSLSLTRPLLVLLGNLDAMNQGERYLDYDMNRLFCQNHRRFPDARESKRAAELEKAVIRFANDQLGPVYHFDLHTAIRGSHHMRFGLLPFVERGEYPDAFVEQLNALALDALVINHAPANTFSFFTKDQLNVESCTLELGSAKPFGHNNAADFTHIDQALRTMLEGKAPLQSQHPALVYRVAQQITKLSDEFRFYVADDVKNFTPYEPGFVLAEDGETRYQVGKQTEYVLFPNPKVKAGLRAGLMLVREPDDS